MSEARRARTYGGCDGCTLDAAGRAPVGWCGPGCARRARRLAVLEAQGRELVAIRAEKAARARALRQPPRWFVELVERRRQQRELLKTGL